MSKECNISLNKKEDKKNNKTNKKFDNLIDLRKKKFFKRTQLINNINNYYKQANNFKLLFKNKENKKTDSFYNTNVNINNLSLKKKPNINNKSKSKLTIVTDIFQIDKRKKSKSKMSHLYIDSYEKKKVKFSLPNDIKTDINKNIDNRNKTSINFMKGENQNKSNFKRLDTDVKLIMMNETKSRKRAKSISFNVSDSNSDFLPNLNLLSKLNKSKKKSVIIDRINTINTSFDIRSKKNNKNSSLNKKYSNNFLKNAIYKTIINNPNLKILYQTNENRIKQSIKCQSKSNKRKFTILKYQKNLIKNTISPLNDDQKYKLMKSFSKINNTVGNLKRINLQKYLNEIQNKEKIIIDIHNKLNEDYVQNIKKIGLSPEKYLFKIERVQFKDIFKSKHLIN